MEGLGLGLDKLKFYMDEKIKTHIVMKPNSRFPDGGEFYNGYINEINTSNPDFVYIKFLEDVKGLIRLFPVDFHFVEEFREK